MLSTWVPPGNPLKIIKFQACLQDPQKPEKVSPGSPKVTKMTPKTTPGTPLQWKSWKSEISQKPLFFIMVIAHTASAFWHHFHLRITKNMHLKTVSHFGIPNHRKITKSPQSDSKGTPQMILKSIKIHTWTSKCLLGDPLDPWITKMVHQVLKMKPQGHQNVSFRYKK